MNQSPIHDTIAEAPSLGYQRFLAAWCRTFRDSPSLYKYPKENEWEWIVDIERENEFKMMPANELIETFPEALTIIKRNLKQKKDELKEKEPEFLRSLDDALEIGAILGMDNAYPEWAAGFFYNRPIGKIENHIRRLERLHDLFVWKDKPRSEGTITAADIERAKQFPIIDLIQINRSGFIPCPFHNENTPSCKIFKDNKFRCFGCGANGDVIDYICKTENLEFLDAVRRILKR